MFNFFLVFIWILQVFKPALMEQNSIWLVEVNKALNVRNVYLIVLSPSHQNQQTTETFESNDDEEDEINPNADSVTLKSVNDCDCNKQQYNLTKGVKSDLRSDYGTDKIVGGTEVDINMYPYHVAYGTNCGGAIIDKKWVITAGHCGKKPYIRVGSRYILQGKKVAVKRNFIHPKWLEKQKEHPFDYDFQLLELSEPLKYDENVQPVRLARIQDMTVGSIMTVTGWGHTVEHGGYSTVLRAVRVPTIRKMDCQKVDYPYFRGSLTPRMFCAGYPEGGKDACQGDSGGPAVADDRLLGLISFGYGCATPGSYGVYSKVALVRDWVEKITGLRLD